MPFPSPVPLLSFCPSLLCLHCWVSGFLLPNEAGGMGADHSLIPFSISTERENGTNILCIQVKHQEILYWK